VYKTESRLSSIVDNVKHPLESETYRLKCKETLDKEGVLVFKELLLPSAIQSILEEAENQKHLAYYCTNDHNVYLKPSDESLINNSSTFLILLVCILGRTGNEFFGL